MNNFWGEEEGMGKHLTGKTERKGDGEALE